MKTFKQMLEAKRTIEPPRNTPEAKFKAKAIKGLKKITEKEFWTPESIKLTNSYNGMGENFSYGIDGEPLFKGNADFSRGKWRTNYSWVYDIRSKNNVSLMISQSDEDRRVLNQEWWIAKY